MKDQTQEAQPVAWSFGIDDRLGGITRSKNDAEWYCEQGWNVQPLYISPQYDSRLLERLKLMVPNFDTDMSTETKVAAYDALKVYLYGDH